MSSVRENLISTLASRLLALSVVGLVVEDGDQSQEFAKTLKDGLCVIELIVGNDENADPASTQEEFKLSCALVLHLPEPLPNGVSARTMGHQLAEAVYGTYGPASQEGMGGYALSARCTMFCGGPYVTAQGTRAALHAVEFLYRFRRGDPTAVV